MKRKKGAIGLFGLVIVGIVILAVLYLLQWSWVQKAFKIKSNAEIFIDINDQTTGLLSILKTKTGDVGCMEALARELESQPPGEAEDECTRLADEIGIAIVLYDEKGEIKKVYGKRKPREEYTTKLQIPLPGGRSSLVGLVSDVRVMPELRTTKGY
jgi:hypothetical protein